MKKYLVLGACMVAFVGCSRNDGDRMSEVDTTPANDTTMSSPPLDTTSSVGAGAGSSIGTSSSAVDTYGDTNTPASTATPAAPMPTPPAEADPAPAQLNGADADVSVDQTVSPEADTQTNGVQEPLTPEAGAPGSSSTPQ